MFISITQREHAHVLYVLLNQCVNGFVKSGVTGVLKNGAIILYIVEEENMKTCKTCKSWKRQVLDDQFIISWGDLWKWSQDKPSRAICLLCDFKSDIHVRMSDTKNDKEKMSKHFRKHHSEDLQKRKVTRLGSCDNKHFIYDSPEDKCQGDDIIVPGALYYMDGEGCSAGFSTDENFGCVHHEET